MKVKENQIITVSGGRQYLALEDSEESSEKVACLKLPPSGYEKGVSLSETVFKVNLANIKKIEDLGNDREMFLADVEPDQSNHESNLVEDIGIESLRP